MADINPLDFGTDGKFRTPQEGDTIPAKWLPAASGSGDMILASAQTNTGLKTFLNATLGLRNILNTFTSLFSNSNTAARTYLLPDANGTVALTSNITDAELTTTDITTNNFTTLKHGFVPKGTNIGSYLKDDGTWSAIAGGGDMVLASAQTNSGIKTFLDTTMKLRNVANTFDGYFVNTNTANRIYTLQNRAGILADDTDLALKAPLISPAFTTPSLGVATATSINGATITSGTLNGTVTGSNTGDNAVNATYADRLTQSQVFARMY